MKILEKIKTRINVSGIGMLILGILIGWLFFGGSGKSSGELPAEHTAEDHKPGELWTCSMHPQIREDEPGQCPICGMDLIKIESSDQDAGLFTVRLSDAALKIAEVSTSQIQKSIPVKEIYLPGKVMPDERRIAEITARYSGRIEKLMINFTGQTVKRGQLLAKIYSPELVNAQKELLESLKFRDSNPRYYQASRKKLQLWDLTEAQINQIEQRGEILYSFDVLSPVTGTVTMRHVSLGDYVKEGSQLFAVIDLSRLWVVFDAYESDLPWISLNDKVQFTVKSMPGEIFQGTVSFIDPIINQNTRVAGVRVEVQNQKSLLKPQMLASGILKATFSGKALLLVPKSSVLWTGKKSVVFVMTGDDNNLFQYREILLGADAGDYYVVEDGLTEGEIVASNGVFKIDASAQLQGKNSMMNPPDGKADMLHDQSDMNALNLPPSGVNLLEDKNEDTLQDVDPVFKQQLKMVFTAYLKLVDALVASNADNAALISSEIGKSLEKVEMTRVKGDAHLKWMNMLDKMEKSIQQIHDSDSLEIQRQAFSGLSDALYQSIKYFDVTGLNAFYQFCPMAMNDQGAYWISTNPEIRNPYFGDAMLTCGATEEELN